MHTRVTTKMSDATAYDRPQVLGLNVGIPGGDSMCYEADLNIITVGFRTKRRLPMPGS